MKTIAKSASPGHTGHRSLPCKKLALRIFRISGSNTRWDAIDLDEERNDKKGQGKRNSTIRPKKFDNGDTESNIGRSRIFYCTRLQITGQRTNPQEAG